MQRIHPGFVLGGRYRLVERIAAGGMGEVWLVEDERLHRPRAIKVLHPHTAAEMVHARRFREEALIGARLEHPNIVAVHDVGDEAGLEYLVMEYVPGRSLADVLNAQGRMTAQAVRRLLEQVGSALGAAHASGIVHRDVKPANILMMVDGTAKLTDFGIAKVAQGLALTKTGELLGTPHYLSPEQALGRQAIPASDVYALGVVAHEALTGVKPFDAETPVAIAVAHAYQDAPELPANTPSDIAELITACLEKDVRRRPADGAAVVARLSTSDPPLRVPDPEPARAPLLKVPELSARPASDLPAQAGRQSGGAHVELAASPPSPATLQRPRTLRPTLLAYVVAAAVLAFFVVLIYLTNR